MKVRKIKMHRHSRNGNRFYTGHDMAIVKHDIEVRNSQIKRGEVVPKSENHYISVCGCGATGCFIHGSKAKPDIDGYKVSMV